MIFDCDTHMSPYRNFDQAVNAEQLNDLLERAGVDQALVWLQPQGVDDVSESNRYIYESAKRFPRLAVPFGWANVMEGEEKALQDARTCLLEYGFKGVKLNGAQNAYNIDSLSALHVCEEIAKNGGIIAFHIGADEPDYTHASRAAVVAKAFPETLILMVHMGGAGEPDRSPEVIAAALDCPNMVLVGSAIGVERVKTAINTLGANRVLYGSDAPFRNPHDIVTQYSAMLEAFDSRTRELVMGQNARILFGLV